MSHFFSHNCCWITLQVSRHQGWKTCAKNGISRGAWNSLMAWPDWPWPHQFTTDLRHWSAMHGLWWLVEKRGEGLAVKVRRAADRRMNLYLLIYRRGRRRFQQSGVDQSGRKPRRYQEPNHRPLWRNYRRYANVVMNICIMPPPLIGGGIKRCFCLTSDICLSVWRLLTSVCRVCDKSWAPQIQLWCWHCAPYKIMLVLLLLSLLLLHRTYVENREA